MFAPTALVSPLSLLETEYDQSQILAIGVNDHSHFEPFDHLAALIKSRGLDPKLKTIIIEDVSVRAPLYNELSVRDLSFDEFKKRATSVYGMFSAHEESLFKTVLPAVREINERRPNDPLIVTSIDGMNTARALEAFVKPVTDIYATSSAREQETARNFKTQVSDVYPGRKVIVAYQATHVAKNLSAQGIVSEGAPRTSLSWLSIATGDSARVILVDSIGEWSTAGVLNLPNDLARPTSIAVGFEWLAGTIDVFKTDTFLRRYRRGTIDVIDTTKPVFDGVILEP